MKRKAFQLFLVISVLFLSNSFLYSISCVTSKCHSNIKKYKFLHGPVGAMQCTVCHQASDKQIKKHMKRPKSFVDFNLQQVKNQFVLCVMIINGKENIFMNL